MSILIIDNGTDTKGASLTKNTGYCEHMCIVKEKNLQNGISLSITPKQKNERTPLLRKGSLEPKTIDTKANKKTNKHPKYP
jgi:hypothetical protein